MNFAADILVLVLMILSNGRVFSIKKTKIDSRVMLSPLAFLIAILDIFAFGVDSFSLLILVISLLVLLSNFHALFRISSKLYVDHYSVLMKIWAFITVILSGATLAALIYFRPGYINAKKSGVAENHFYYSGTFSTGFSKTERLSAADVFITEYEPETPVGETTPKMDIILFMPDKRGDTASYAPYLINLAKEGNKVYSADFFAKDGRYLHTFADSHIMRRFGMVGESLRHPVQFETQKEFYTFNIFREFEAVLNILSGLDEDATSVIIVTDYIGTDAANDFQKKYPDKVKGIVDISQFADSYLTSGYGFVSTTNPLLCYALGVESDRSATNSIICARRTESKIAEIKRHEQQ